MNSRAALTYMMQQALNSPSEERLIVERTQERLLSIAVIQFCFIFNSCKAILIQKASHADTNTSMNVISLQMYGDRTRLDIVKQITRRG